MADISKITLPSGTTYDIKDASARADIATLQNVTTGAMHYLGVTTTALTNGASTNPITIGGNSVTATSGSVVIYGSLEFVFSSTDNKWHEFGSTGSLKALAFKDSASGTYTPAGSVSVSTNTTTNKTTTVSAAGSGTTTYTPAGTVTQPTFSGTAGTVTVSGTPTGNVTISKASSGTANYTPEGTNSGGAVTLNTTTVNSITAVGTLPTCSLPSLSATVANETLTLSWEAGSFNAGTLPTKGENQTVATSVNTFTQPTFTGTGARLTGSFSGTAFNSTGSFTPEGTVTQPTFTGTGVRLVTGNIEVPSTYTASFTGTEATITVS